MHSACMLKILFLYLCACCYIETLTVKSNNDALLKRDHLNHVN